MKRILLLILAFSLFGFLAAQDNTWELYLQGQAVKSVEFENDYVWVVTDSFLVRLNKLDKSTTYYPFPDILEDMRSHLTIDKTGVKWVVRSISRIDELDNSIYGFDGSTWEKIEYNGTGLISSLAVDKNNNKWITESGFAPHLYKLEQGSSTLDTYENSGFIINPVCQVVSDNHWDIWLGDTKWNTDSTGWVAMALWKYDGKNWNSFPGPPVSFPRIVFDDAGFLWIQGFRNDKLVKWDLSDNSGINYLTFNDYNLVEAIDRENRVWLISTKDKGIAVYNGLDWNFYTIFNSELRSNTVYQIAIDAEGTKWIATANGLVAFNENDLKGTTGLDSRVMNEFDLYPNPAKDFITLKMPGEIQNSTIDILNIQGIVMKSFSNNVNQNRLDVSHFPAGVYLVRIQSEGNHILKKFVKQ